MVLISVKWLFMHFDSCHAYIFYIQLFQKRIKIQINIWRNTFYKERVHVYICGFLTSSILIDEVNNYTGVILTIACFDLNCPLFTCLDFWHRLSSIVFRSLNPFIFVYRFISFVRKNKCFQNDYFFLYEHAFLTDSLLSPVRLRAEIVQFSGLHLYITHYFKFGHPIFVRSFMLFVWHNNLHEAF